MIFNNSDNETIWKTRENYLCKLFKFEEVMESYFVIILDIKLYSEPHLKNDLRYGIYIKFLSANKIAKTKFYHSSFLDHFHEIL